MSSRIKEHHDHTAQSIFHHGLIKLIISSVLQKEGKTWDYFLFWSGFQNNQEGQPTRKHVDKGQTLIRKLRQKFKVEDKKCVKLEEVSEPSKGDYESQQPSADSENKNLLFLHKETQPVQNKAPAETFIDERIVFTGKVLGDEENTKVQQRIPITILSEDEGYLLEGDELTVSAETRASTHREFSNQEDKIVMPKKKKIKVKEFASIMHQRKSLK